MRSLSFLPALLLSVGLAHGAAAKTDAVQNFRLPFGAAPGAAARPAPTDELPLRLAQASDAAFRVQQLEEEVRQLNGRIEDLNFQLLQMQEQMRKMQEDNEFRFQELEQGRAGGKNEGTASARKAPDGDKAGAVPGKSQPSEQATGAQRSDGDEIARVIEGGAPSEKTEGINKTVDGVEIYQGPPAPAEEGGLQTQSLGTLTFDADGNVVNSDVEKPIDLTGRAGGNPAPRDDTVASLELPSDPEQLYELGYNYIQAGEYALAEDAFEEFSARYPDNAKIAEARFWVGESLLSRKLFEDAAKVFLDAHKRYPDSRMGPQTLLKLGISLAGMDQRELACATLAEVPKKYPDASGAIQAKVAAEQKTAGCK